MKIRFPSRLVSGDLVAITAPSSGVPAHRHARFDLAINALKSKGFRVVEGQCLRSQHKNKSADKALRASELMQFLCDPEVKAVMPPWGGDLAIELLELIDFEKLKAVEPKWFSGFSDLTTLHLPLTTELSRRAAIRIGGYQHTGFIRRRHRTHTAANDVGEWCNGNGDV